MKIKYILTCFFLTTLMFSQIVDKPVSFKKINFVYETKSNYSIKNQGVYADTLLLKFDFPNLKYVVLDNSLKTENYNGFIPLIDFKNEDLKKLISILYHTNEKYVGEYDRIADETFFKIFRDDETTKKIFNEIFKSSYQPFQYTIKINYKKNTIIIKYPNISYKNKINESVNSITFQNDTTGLYYKTIGNLHYTNVVILNDKLDSKIMSDEIFSNNKWGVEQIKTLSSFTVLKNVSYSN